MGAKIFLNRVLRALALIGQPIKTESQERVTKENIPEGLQDFCKSLEISNGND